MNTPPENRPDPKIVILLGIPFHDVSMQETLDYMDTMIESRKPGYLATANLDFTAQASGDVELQRILFDADLVLCDGTPLVWASRWLGAPLRERVAGSDLLPHLFAHAAMKGHRLFFLGSTPEVLKIAEEKCLTDYPGIIISGSYAPAYARLLDIDHAEICRRIREAHPDILLVAMGCPKQEKWIYMNYRSIGVPVCIGIGASLDFIAGKFRRAPVWMRGCGLEWVFRLLQEPRRLFNRYMFDLVFFVRELRRQRRLLLQKSKGSAEAKREYLISSQTVAQYKWSGRIDAEAVRGKSIEAPSPERGFPNVLLNCSGVTFIDSTGLGLFVKSFRLCKEAGGTFVLFMPSPAVTRMLSTLHIDRLIPTSRSEEETLRLLRTSMPCGTDVPFFDRDARELAVSLSGDITAANVEACEQTITKAWNLASDATYLKLDMERIHFIDSSGLGLLVKMLKLVKQRAGGTLNLVNLSQNVRNVIRVANMETVLGLAGDSRQEGN